MVESNAKKDKKPDGPTCDRALLCPEEWVDPESRKVLGEFHKEGLPEGMLVDADLERFEEYWSSRGSVNMQGSYHKKGAPYLDGAVDKDEIEPQSEDEPTPVDTAPEMIISEESPKPRIQMPISGRSIDLATIEIATYALFRAVFGKEISIPLKKEGIINADITIRNKDIIFNTNEFYSNIPDLAVWRVVYTHQGSPIFELGRGVPKGLRVYRWNAFKLVFSLWRQTRAATKAKEKLAKERKEASMNINSEKDRV